MVKEINTIPSESTVIDGAKAMAADINAEGYAIVLKGGKPVGIITERDIVNRVLARDLDPSRTKVEEVMSSPLIGVDPDDDLVKASERMREKNVRKLVVMRDEIAYGILTAKDIAQHLRDYVEKSVRDILLSTPYL
jgi:CBS domain-containing protein